MTPELIAIIYYCRIKKKTNPSSVLCYSNIVRFPALAQYVHRIRKPKKKYALVWNEIISSIKD